MLPSWQDIAANIEDIVGETIGEYNDVATRQRLLHTISGFLNTLVEHRALYDYRVICDETNNPSCSIAEHSLIVDVTFSPLIGDDFDLSAKTPIDYLAITRDVACAKFSLLNTEYLE